MPEAWLMRPKLQGFFCYHVEGVALFYSFVHTSEMVPLVLLGPS